MGLNNRTGLSMTTGWKEKDDYTIAAIRTYLEREELDLFIPWKTQHVAYLCNYYDAIHADILWDEMMSMLAIPRDSDAFIVGEHPHVAGAEEFGVAPWWLTERHAGGRPGAKTLARLIELIRKKGLDRGRIGIEYKWMPTAIYKHLRAELPNAEFAGADLLVPQVRLIKTPREQALLRKAAEIGLTAMDTFMQAMRSGSSREEARIVRAQKALDLGGEWVGGIDRVAWTGGIDETLAWWDPDARQRFVGSSARRWRNIPDDAPFLITHFESRYQYYLADLAWHEFYKLEPDVDSSHLLTFGEYQVSLDEAHDDFGVLRRAQQEALNQITPGMNHWDAKKAVDAFLDQDPEIRKHVGNYYIHGIGLEVHEEPILTGFVPEPTPQDGPIVFQPGAVVSSEWFTNLWTVEEPFVMTDNGWDSLVQLRGLTGNPRTVTA